MQRAPPLSLPFTPAIPPPLAPEQTIPEEVSSSSPVRIFQPSATSARRTTITSAPWLTPCRRTRVVQPIAYLAHYCTGRKDAAAACTSQERRTHSRTDLLCQGHVWLELAATQQRALPGIVETLHMEHVSDGC